MITLANFMPYTDQYHETGNQVHEWVLNRARAHFAADARRKAGITDREGFQTYRDECRQHYLGMVGPLSDAAGAPATEITGILERDGYTVRKLIMQGRSGLYIAANAYFPAALPGQPVPGVLMVCGHSRDGKAAPLYQQVCIDLVRIGLVVCIIDSPGHGELVQCVDPHSGAPLAGTNTLEHSYLQLAASVLSRNIMREFINNARTGLDWLAAQPEVDAARLAVTGNSGGGHMTQALMMVDDRVQVAMSCCSQTTREKYLENGVRAYDGEQNYYGCIPAGLDYDDFFAAFAPRPLRIGAAAHDYFAIEGVLEAVERARRIYRLFDAEDQIDCYIAPDEHHGYTAPLRRGCVEWFARHLSGKTVAAPAADPTAESPETLQCTRSGQVRLDYPDAPSILDLLRQEWDAVRQRASSGTRSLEDLRQRLDLPAAIEPPAHVRRTARATEQGVTADRIFFFSEPGIIVTGVVYSCLPSPARATLLLIPDGTAGQDPYRQRISERVANGELVLVFDPRGIGAVQMRRRNQGQGLAHKSTEFRLANDHFLLRTSLASRRVFDVLRASAYLRSRPDVSAEQPVEIEAHGWPALYGLLAAAVGEAVIAGPMTGLPESWEALFTVCDRHAEPFAESLIVPALRGEWDLDDLRRLAITG